MADSIGDLVVKLNADTSGLKKGLTDASKSVKVFGDNTEAISKNLKIAGGVMLGFAATMAAGIGVAIKAAAEEEAGIVQLATSLKNIGVSWEKTGASLEKYIDAQMQMTAFSDDEQRKALSNLVVATGNLTKAQDLLSLSMDLARWKSMDLSTASDMITRVYAGNTGTLSRYGITVREGASATEALAQIQKMAAGQAEAYGKTTSGQLEILKNNFDDLKEEIGGALLPVIQPLIQNITDFIRELKETDPEIVNAIAQMGLLVTPLVAVGGGFLVLVGALPSIKAGMAALNLILDGTVISVAGLQVAMWELTLLILALTMLAYGLWLLWRNKIQGEVLDPDMWKQLAKDIGGAIKPLTGAMMDTVSDELDKIKQSMTGVAGAADGKLTPSIVKTGNAARYSVEAFNEWYDALQAMKKASDEWAESQAKVNREIQINNALVAEQIRQVQKQAQGGLAQGGGRWNFADLFRIYGTNADDLRRIMATGMAGGYLSDQSSQEAAIYEIMQTNDINAAGGGGISGGGYNPNLNVTVQIDGEQVASVTSVAQGSDINQRSRMGG